MLQAVARAVPMQQQDFSGYAHQAPAPTITTEIVAGGTAFATPAATVGDPESAPAPSQPRNVQHSSSDTFRRVRVSASVRRQAGLPGPRNEPRCLGCGADIKEGVVKARARRGPPTWGPGKALCSACVMWHGPGRGRNWTQLPVLRPAKPVGHLRQATQAARLRRQQQEEIAARAREAAAIPFLEMQAEQQQPKAQLQPSVIKSATGSSSFSAVAPAAAQPASASNQTSNGGGNSSTPHDGSSSSVLRDSQTHNRMQSTATTHSKRKAEAIQPATNAMSNGTIPNGRGGNNQTTSANTDSSTSPRSVALQLTRNSQHSPTMRLSPMLSPVSTSSSDDEPQRKRMNVSQHQHQPQPQPPQQQQQQQLQQPQLATASRDGSPVHHLDLNRRVQHLESIVADQGRMIGEQIRMLSEYGRLLAHYGNFFKAFGATLE